MLRSLDVAIEGAERQVTAPAGNREDQGIGKTRSCIVAKIARRSSNGVLVKRSVIIRRPA